MAKNFASDASDFDSTAIVAGPAKASAKGLTGLLTSIVERLALSRQKRVDLEVGEFIESHGGQLTDDLERQISRRFGSQAGQW